MKISQAFKEIQEDLQVSGAALNRKTGITAKHISQFRQGANAKTDTLDTLLSALEEIAEVEIRLLAIPKDGDREGEQDLETEVKVQQRLTRLLDSPECLLQAMSKEQIEEFFRAMAITVHKNISETKPACGKRKIAIV
ncbi:MAG: hypothetical protein J7647_09300 [Cyanobacteria bacterium SBLK]|nr:hypothetical protein [Cyanobacteria bacterium SBLK]